MLNVNDSAPNIVGVDVYPIPGSGTFTLSDHSGDVICLAFVSYTAGVNPDCSDLLTRMENLWNDYGSGAHGVQMVAVICSPDQAAAWTYINSLGLTFPVVQDDPANTNFSAYNTGTPGLPQLYIIDRDMLISATALGLQTETVINGYIEDAIYTRDPVNIELVMDVSGSMNYPGPGGGSDKLVLMRQAADMVVDFLTLNGQVGDRLGLVWFSDTPDDHLVGPTHFLSPITDAIALTGAISSQPTGNCTAMGAGLQTAFDNLSGDPSPNDRFAILLTDGMQNIEPTLEWVGGFGGHFEIIDSGNGSCGPHSGTAAHPGVNISAYDTKVHAIGVGITATYGSLLMMLAGATSGFYQGTNSPASDLDLIYFVNLCNCLAGGSPTVIHHHAGTHHREKCRSVEVFQVSRSIRKFTAMLSWEKELKGNLTFWLRAPDGTLLDLHSEMRLFDSYAMATVYLPSEKDGVKLPYVGQWEMIIGGVTDESSVPYHAMVIGEDPELKFTLDYPRKEYEVGDIVPLAVSLAAKEYTLLEPIEIVLEHSFLPVPVSELLADYKPNPELISELMNAGCEECKPNPLELRLESLSRDPRMQDKLKPVHKSFSLKDGELDCKITGEGIILPVMLTQPGLNSFRVTAHFENEKIGPVKRVSTISVHAGPGKVNPGRTNLKPVRVSVKGDEAILFYVSPRNSAGQLLGPGLNKKEFEVKIGRSSLECEVKDNLDGSYRVKTPSSKEAEAKGKTASITYKGDPLWKGDIE